MGEFLRYRRDVRRGANRIAVRSDCADYRIDETKHWSRVGCLRHSDSNAFLRRAPDVGDHQRAVAWSFERSVGSRRLWCCGSGLLWDNSPASAGDDGIQAGPFGLDLAHDLTVDRLCVAPGG